MNFFLLLLIVCYQVRSDDDLFKPCDFDDLLNAVSAYNRVSTIACKNQIAFHACQSKSEKKIQVTPTCQKIPNRLVNKTDNKYVKRSKDFVSKEFEVLKSIGGLPRIVFFFTVTGRSIRQILRLLKSIYNEYHYYYFHIDERSSFLKSELQKISWLDNYYVANWSMATIWGGASLLQMHLKAMKELYEYKKNGKWNWDFLINLSESDYPIKSVEDLTLYLKEYPNTNFLQIVQKERVDKFVKNSGIQYKFVECENRMWRINKREMLDGIEIGGGSDWFCLHSDFIEYILTSNDEYLIQLKNFYRFTLLPSESFFHTVILNSQFCDKFINNNLKVENWNREIGCSCNYYNSVDWCGCSPNFFTNDDFLKIQNYTKKPKFFARKFDPIFKSQIINKLDQSVNGLFSTSYKSTNSYWLNVFKKPNDAIKNHMFKSLLDYFMISSTEYLSEYLNSLDESSMSFQISEMIKSISDNQRLDSIAEVNSFFQMNKFKGFVMNVKTLFNSKIFDYEVFITPVQKKAITKINEGVLKPDEFLSLVNKFEISTDYDSKEQMFYYNYASVIQQKSNPILLIAFDFVPKSMNLTFVWTNSQNITVKNSKLTFNTTNESKLVLNGFFGIDSKNNRKFKDDGLKSFNLNSSGIWKLDVNVHNLDSNNTILSREFLVIPEDTPFNSEKSTNNFWSEIFGKFWTIKSICLRNKSNFKNDLGFLFANSEFIENCEETAYWSSFYPDPKSEFLYPSILQKCTENSERITLD